ncbi:tyrosine-type recombinase/integrase [Herbidospora mongoliensis]|uniref:tyrosine-type recombinase/integrase n=1 Tax=Herbidospora mongoliensis TaxID=688067 RepID=UPI001C3F2A4F|nr:site-specific integrase [Herbidospora mongoliensis]
MDVAAGRVQVKDAAAKWRADLLHRGSTSERMERVFRLHIDPIIGHMQMAHVRPAHIRSWVKDRSAVLAPSTLAVVYSNLVSFFGAAVIDRAIGISPCLGVRLPDSDKAGHFVPIPDQVHTLAENLPPRYSAVSYLAAGCGMRGGEIFGLEIDQLDLKRREVDISQQLVCISGQAPYLAPPKTKTSARTAELPKVVCEALAAHLKRFEPVEIEIVDATDPRNVVTRTARLVFTTNMLQPMHRATWAHIWAPAARTADIPKGVGLHCLRHYFATLLIHKGASVKAVQLALGHSTPMVTLNTYVGEWPEAGEKTRRLVDESLGHTPRLA